MMVFSSSYGYSSSSSSTVAIVSSSSSSTTEVAVVAVAAVAIIRCRASASLLFCLLCRSLQANLSGSVSAFAFYILSWVAVLSRVKIKAYFDFASGIVRFHHLSVLRIIWCGHVLTCFLFSGCQNISLSSNPQSCFLVPYVIPNILFHRQSVTHCFLVYIL